MTVWYMSGAGNDFVITDARGKNIDMSLMAIELCEKENCDGFMALDSSNIADFKLHFYNRDGSRAEMCGNGVRCICRFAYDNGIAGEKMTIETDSGIVEGERVSADIYRIKLSAPKDIELNKKADVDYAVVGVPHAAIEVENLDFNQTNELFELGRRLRGELNANINFYQRVAENIVKILTYERGVEDFTLACGTGSSAVAVILWHRGLLDGGRLTLQNQGGELVVTLCVEKDKINALYLEGDAKVLKMFEI